MKERHIFSAIACFLLILTLSACRSDNGTLALGEEIVGGTCIKCHAAGINGAPILGNNKMWASRANQGIPTLVKHASEGYGLMPAKGGNTDLTEEDMTAAVSYMLSLLDEHSI